MDVCVCVCPVKIKIFISKQFFILNMSFDRLAHNKKAKTKKTKQNITLYSKYTEEKTRQFVLHVSIKLHTRLKNKKS